MSSDASRKVADQKKPEVEVELLTASQVAAIPLLAVGRLKKDAAAAIGVTPQTVSVWFGQPQFRAALALAREELAAMASQSIADAASSAIATILDLLQHGRSESTRLRAACYVLDQVFAASTVDSESSERTSMSVDMKRLLEAMEKKAQ